MVFSGPKLVVEDTRSSKIEVAIPVATCSVPEMGRAILSRVVRSGDDSFRSVRSPCDESIDTKEESSETEVGCVDAVEARDVVGSDDPLASLMMEEPRLVVGGV